MTKTNNQIIAASLRIKDLSKARYINKLTSMDLRLVESDNSIQGYMAVEHMKTGKRLLISKDMKSKPGLFSGYSMVGTNDHGIKQQLEDVDLLGFLSAPDKPFNSEEFTWHKNTRVRRVIFPETKTQRYKRLQDSVESQDWKRQRAINLYNSAEAEIAKIQERMRRFVKEELEYETGIANAKKEMKNLVK